MKGGRLVNGWRVDCEYLIGRRFEWSNGAAPDITFVSGKTGDDGRDSVRAHALDGGVEWLPLDDVCEAIAAGILVESERGVPFVNEGPVTTTSPTFAKTYHSVKGFYPGARR